MSKTKQASQPLSAKAAAVLLTLAASALMIPALPMMTWREEIGASRRYLGLFKIEVTGCGGGQSSGIAGYIANMGCMGAGGEIIQGKFSWSEYRMQVCQQTSMICGLSGLTAALNLDAGDDQCKSLQDRCNNLDRVMIVNMAVAGGSVLGLLCCVAASAAVITNQMKGSIVVLAMLAALLLDGAVIGYFMFGDDTFGFATQTTSISSTGPGIAFFLAAGSALATLFFFFAMVAMTKSTEYEDSSSSDEEEGSSKKSKKQKKEKKEKKEQQHSPDSYGSCQAQTSQYQAVLAQTAQVDDESKRYADAHLQQISQLLRSRGATDLAQAFRGFDTNGDGYISYAEFQTGLDSLDAGLTQEQVLWLMGWIDKDKSGYVHWQEFVDEMQRAQV